MINIIEFDIDEQLLITGFSVLIEIPDEEKKSASGIVYERNSERERIGSCVGVIAQVGPLAGKDPGDKPTNWAAVVGKKVLFSRYQGVYARRRDGKCYMIIQEKNILAEITKVKETEDVRV